jgi:phosphoglycolate phosphatase-like HAD superfamily hydrolase
MFEIMSVLIGDPEIKKYAFIENYFSKVDEVMKSYLGNVSKESRTKFARNLYAMTVVAEAEKSDLAQGFVRYLRKLKNNYNTALVTTAPEPAVEPMLEKLGCKDLFTMIYKSKPESEPNKKQLFLDLIRENGTPVMYACSSMKDVELCRELGVKSVLVHWITPGCAKGDYSADSPADFEKILEKKLKPKN